jgi:OOP family OmpA-OmpF porin
MKNIVKITAQSALAAAMMMAGSAFAADAGTYYLGWGVGTTNSDYSSSTCNTDFGVPDCKVSSNGTNYKLLAGYNFSSMFAVEAAYGNLGDVKIESQSAGGSLTQKTMAFNVDGVANFAMGSGFDLNARLGAFSADTKSSGGGGTDGSANKTGLDFGVGASYDFNKNIIGRIDVQRFTDVSKDSDPSSANTPTFKNNLTLISLALVYNF